MEDQTTDVNKLNVRELKALLKSKSLSVKGRKHELKKRLLTSMKKTSNVIESSQMSEEKNSDTEPMLKVKDFNLYVNEYEAFKSFILDKVKNVLQTTTEKIDHKEKANAELLEENKFLKEQLRKEQSITTNLRSEVNILKEKINSNTKQPNKVDDFSRNRLHNNPFYALNVEPSNEVWFTGKQPRSRLPQSKSPNESLRRNGFVIDENPESNYDKHQTMQENQFASPEKKVLLVGDSLIKRVKSHEIKKHVARNARFVVKSFPGATSEEINHYVEPALDNEKPDMVIIHTGTNDMYNRRSPKSIPDIANGIIKIGKKCRERGVKNIFISGIVFRRPKAASKKVFEINNLVRALCGKENFYFIHNNSIKDEHLWDDGLHLLDEGRHVLVNNFAKALNNIL